MLLPCYPPGKKIFATDPGKARQGGVHTDQHGWKKRDVDEASKKFIWINN
jgi:hypothetical protein